MAFYINKSFMVKPSTLFTPETPLGQDMQPSYTTPPGNYQAKLHTKEIYLKHSYQ